MSGNWAQTGWDGVDDGYEESSSSSESSDQNVPRTFWMPPDVTKRIMFLGNAPFRFFEHSLYAITKSGKDRAICLAKNKLDDRGCPVCDNDMYPSHIGYFTVIDMGDVIEEDGDVRLKGFVTPKGNVIQFQRKLYGAKRGGKDKPGVLKEIQRLVSKRGGDLTGTVWDVYRTGGKAEGVGDRFEFIERVAMNDWEKYFTDLGANPDNLDLDVIDYGSVFVPYSYEKLQAIVGGKHPDAEPVTGKGARSEGAGYGGPNEPPKNDAPPPDDQDDLPF